MATPKKATVHKERTAHTYSELWHASSCTLEKGVENAKASAWQFLASIMLTAFTFEAYLNHAGEKIFSCWAEVERLPPLAKLSLLCEKLEISFTKGARPYGTIIELFNFRDEIAHGKSKTVKHSSSRDLNDNLDKYLGQRQLLNWETKIQNIDFAERSREDVKKVIEKIHTARPEPKEPSFSFGISIHNAQIGE